MALLAVLEPIWAALGRSSAVLGRSSLALSNSWAALGLSWTWNMSLKLQSYVMFPANNVFSRFGVAFSHLLEIVRGSWADLGSLWSGSWGALGRSVLLLGNMTAPSYLSSSIAHSDPLRP